MANYQKIKALPITAKEEQAINEARKLRGWREAKYKETKDQKSGEIVKELVEAAGFLKGITELSGDNRTRAEQLAKEMDRLASTRLVIDYLNRVRITQANAKLLISRRLGRYNMEDVQKMLNALDREANAIRELALSTPEIASQPQEEKEWTVEAVLADAVGDELEESE